MRLCTFEVKSRFGSGRRLGMETAAGRTLDLNSAYALTLVEEQQHPRASELANVLVPPSARLLQHRGHVACTDAQSRRSTGPHLITSSLFAGQALARNGECYP